MDEELLAGIGEIRDHLPTLLDIGPYGTLTHYDIWQGNVIVDFQGGRPRVSGFVDISGYFADYARELPSMYSLPDERLRQVYEERHGIDEGCAARIELYDVKMHLQMFRQYPSEPAHMDTSKQHLRRVQACLA